jgi:hypothetical protein
VFREVVLCGVFRLVLRALYQASGNTTLRLVYRSCVYNRGVLSAFEMAWLAAGKAGASYMDFFFAISPIEGFISKKLCLARC